MEGILQLPQPRQYNLYYPDMPTLRELMTLAGRSLGHELFSYPSVAMLLIPLSILHRLRINAPVDVDNLRGYITSLEVHHTTDLAEVLPHWHSLKGAVMEAFRTDNLYAARHTPACD